jgi:predicted dehydrogenase
LTNEVVQQVDIRKEQRKLIDIGRLELVHKGWHKPARMALIGCGRIAHSYATVIDNRPDMKLASVVDVNPEAARAFGTSFRCNFHTSLEEYLCSEDMAECAVICTPPSDQAEAACKLMQKGISVLCETPFSLNSASALKMLDVSRTFGAQLMMGSRFRYISDVIHAKGLIQAGIIGQLLVFEIDFRDSVDMRNRWNIRPEISGGGVLMDTGSHAVDIVRYLIDPVIRVRAEEASRVQSPDVEDTVRVDLSTASGVIGSINLSWTIKNADDDYIRIYGTQGTLCIGWKTSMYRPSGAVDWIRFGEGFSTLKAITRQLVNLVEVVANDGIPETTAEDGFEAVRVIEAAYQSLPTGKWISLLEGSAAAIPTDISNDRRFPVLCQISETGNVKAL